MKKTTLNLAVALSAFAAAVPVVAVAQAKDPKLVTCAELMAMQAEEQMELLRALVAASANALDLNDLVTSTTTIGPLIEICRASPDMLAMDAAMQMAN